jgi:hypothetical protein
VDEPNISRSGSRSALVGDIFHPLPTDDLYSWVKSLWEALACAEGEHFSPSTQHLGTPKGELVAFYIAYPPSPKVKQIVRRFVHAYARASGWTVHRVTFHQNRMEMLTSPTVRADGRRR